MTLLWSPGFKFDRDRRSIPPGGRSWALRDSSRPTPRGGLAIAVIHSDKGVRRWLQMRKKDDIGYCVINSRTGFADFEPLPPGMSLKEHQAIVLTILRMKGFV